MKPDALLGLPPGLRLVRLTVLPSGVVAEVCSHRVSRPCPRCRGASDCVHSYYVRTVADVPCAGRQVRMTLRVRKFRCPDNTCARKVFAERFPDYVRPWARKTARLVERMTSLGMAAAPKRARRPWAWASPIKRSCAC